MFSLPRTTLKGIATGMLTALIWVALIALMAGLMIHYGNTRPVGGQ